MSTVELRRKLRLFFALWPDAATRNGLVAVARELRQSCGGRSTPDTNLHMTLAFLGAVDAQSLPALQALAAAIVTVPFELDMARLGFWRAQRLVWAAPSDCPPPLTALAGRLADALRSRGFHTERRPFKPHVTLLRDAGAAPPAPGLPVPLRWPVRGFVLASSEPAPRGVRYRVLGQWPVAGSCL